METITLPLKPTTAKRSLSTSSREHKKLIADFKSLTQPKKVKFPLLKPVPRKLKIKTMKPYLTNFSAKPT